MLILLINVFVETAEANLVASPSVQLKEESYAIGQMMTVGFKGSTIDEHSIIVQEIKNYHIGGVILFFDQLKRSKQIKPKSNIVNPLQLKQLTTDLQF